MISYFIKSPVCSFCNCEVSFYSFICYKKHPPSMPLQAQEASTHKRNELAHLTLSQSKYNTLISTCRLCLHSSAWSHKPGLHCHFITQPSFRNHFATCLHHNHLYCHPFEKISAQPWSSGPSFASISQNPKLRIKLKDGN